MGAQIYKTDIDKGQVLMFANNDGYHSTIKPELGSKFIQILCEELENNYRYFDMLSILTFVNRQMALPNKPSDQTLRANNQAGNIISTLTRLVCFPSKNFRNPVKEKPKFKCKMPICEQMADSYNFTHKRRGVALIFIHERFDNAEIKNRNGIEADKKLVECFLSKLGFEIRMYNDLKLAQITEVLTSVANADHSDADCFLICVSTSGDDDILHAKDGSYEPEKLWVPFTGDKCKTLTGKPKIFIVQASRGEKLDDGVSVLNTDNQLYTIPEISDILIMYSTYPGYHSWRNPERGSWFIQNLCEELENNYNNHDLMTILTYVNRKMALFCQSNTPNLPEMNKKKQVGNIVSTLTRLMYFCPKKKYVTQSGQLFETPMCEKMADCYNVSYGRRGVALIFIQETFDHLINEQRKGTERDKIAMEKVLSELDFEIRIHKDLIYEQIMSVISNVAKEDHSDADCLLICVMSLGDSDVIYAKDCTYEPQQLWTQFTGDKCRTLAGKPKLFFVQASRGNRQDGGATVRCSNNNDTYTIPAMSDILVMYSAYKGYFSWRNVVDGSWLIQSIEKEIENKSNYNDFLKILTFVNRRMALFFQSNMPSDKSMHQKKQVSTIMSTLTRRIDFTSAKKSTENNIILKLTVCDKMADSYNFRHKYRGVALIFVHKHFEDKCEARKGIEYDTISLKTILIAFGFEVRIYADLSRTEIVTIIANVAHEDHSDADCLLICVMSRGDQEKIYARDGPYAPDILWTSFSANLCKTLAGKPKLLFIQGGNNSTFHNGAIVDGSIEAGNDYNYNIPAMSDILIMYSTYKGYYSWRNTNKGSWFIEALCQELNRNYRESDLMTMLTFVNRKVSMFYVSNVVGGDKTMGKKKQLKIDRGISVQWETLFTFRISLEGKREEFARKGLCGVRI
ncbi:Death related ICE-like caspase [Carabus blaptoides fortunei]